MQQNSLDTVESGNIVRPLILRALLLVAHYEKTIQIYRKFHLQKLKIFR